jgi:hypothetical protein
MVAEAAAFLVPYALIAMPFGRGTGLKQMVLELRPGWGRRSNGGAE